MARAPATIAIDTNPAMKAYSIAVAARSSARNRRMIRMLSSPNYVRKEGWKKR
jgi:hypothetical protein